MAKNNLKMDDELREQLLDFCELCEIMPGQHSLEFFILHIETLEWVPPNLRDEVIEFFREIQAKRARGEPIR